MAGSVNKVILIGNLGRDPEVRTTQAGDKVVNLSVATSERWKDRASGEPRERTEWHRVVIFNERLADVAEKVLRKGVAVVRASPFVRAQPGLCGVGLQVPFWKTGGYTYFHVTVPIFEVPQPFQLRKFAPAFNVLLFQRGAKIDPGLGYSTLRCFDEMCVARRPGGCVEMHQP